MEKPGVVERATADGIVMVLDPASKSAII